MERKVVMVRDWMRLFSSKVIAPNNGGKTAFDLKAHCFFAWYTQRERGRGRSLGYVENKKTNGDHLFHLAKVEKTVEVTTEFSLTCTHACDSVETPPWV